MKNVMTQYNQLQQVCSTKYVFSRILEKKIEQKNL